MEKIKVNMSPNPLDVQTIHASQNDGEARQWEFELHNNGELIDTSDITEQLFFKAYKGGTEQILPENTSTPTTSPFIGDIKYPQGLLSDQEFLYRESPTESDGLAKITDIKGNTIVWNQLVENGDFSASRGWTGQFATVTISNNVASVRQDRAGDYVALRKSNLNGLTGHKYLAVADVKSAKKTAIAFYLSNTYSSAYDIQANTRTVVHAIITVSNANDSGFNVYTNRKVELAEGDVVEFYHVMLFDLTQMGLNITDPSDFTSLFPLSYYSYNQGSLLSFNGNGIKTVWFNLFDQDSVLTSVGFVKQSDGSFYIQSPSIANNVVLFENKLKYSGQFFLVYKYKYEGTTGEGCRFRVHYTDGTIYHIYAPGSNDFVEISFISRANKIVDYIDATYGSNISTWWKDVCINFSDPERNGTYEPYTSSTLSLPISTYFPTGMKSAGSVYDELTPRKAITRIGAVDLGSLTWTYESGWRAFKSTIADAKRVTSSLNANWFCSRYSLKGSHFSGDTSADMTVDLNSISHADGVITIRDTSFNGDATAFTNSLQGVYLYYELATPTETSFTTASLVTENAEIPLSNEDGTLIGKCTEELSSESGFFDAKIKLADGDGECYSNKIQLHVERSPQ